MFATYFKADINNLNGIDLRYTYFLALQKYKL